MINVVLGRYFRGLFNVDMEDLVTVVEELIKEMITYDRGDPKRIQHFLKVHEFAKLIGTMENLEEKTLETLELAAVVHDIGIHNSEKKYGDCNGPHQEMEGPPEARKLLERLGADEKMTDRICYLVGHHHTYNNITEADYQILVEADFLVNLYEDGESLSAVKIAYNRIFKTETGRKICRDMFGITEE